MNQLHSKDNFDFMLIDFIELIDFTLSNKFVERWKGKYSTKFLSHFQARIMKGLQDQRVLKLSTLFTHLTKTCGYDQEQVYNFLDSIEIDIYSPFVSGHLEDFIVS